MYTLVRRFIKTGVAFLVLGLLLGLHMVVTRELRGTWPSPYLVSAHTHVILVGFVLFLIMGVALWLFPRAAKEDTRYSPALAAVSYWVMTLATGGRFATEIGRAYSGAEWLPWAVVTASAGQLLGLVLYFWMMWGRIRPVGSHLREAKGERF